MFMRRARSSENGSVFFIILLAIAMFAMLSYAVSKGSRSSASALTEEKSRLMAQEIISYSESVAKAVQTLRLRGVGETQISFEGTLGSLNYQNPNCTTTDCRVFAPSGGAVTPLAPPANSNNGTPYFFGGRVYFNGVGGNTGAEGAELYMFLPYVDRNLCLALNKVLKVPTRISNPAEPPQDAGAGNYIAFPFQGTFTGGNAIGSNVADGFTGYTSACYEGGSSPPAGTYHFYKVLIVR